MINSQDELKSIVEWLLNTIDTIDTICSNDGYLRNQFSFATDELKDLITKILNEIDISIAAKKISVQKGIEIKSLKENPSLKYLLGFPYYEHILSNNILSHIFL